MRRTALALAIAGGIMLAPSVNATTVAIDYADDTGGFFQTVKNSFSYDYTFTLDEAGYLTASLTSSAVSNPITFTSVTLNGVELLKSATDNSYSLLSTIAADAGTQIFHVEGIASTRATTFSGTVQYVSAVPETGTWAMMIGGFALVAGQMRRRRTAPPAHA
jgi:hypothetical protein